MLAPDVAVQKAILVELMAEKKAKAPKAKTKSKKK